MYEEQEALSAYGGYWELQHAGLFYAGVGVRPGKEPGAVEALLFAEIERLRSTPPTAAELEKAKRVFEVGMLGGLGTANALAGRNAEELLDVRPHPPDPGAARRRPRGDGRGRAARGGAVPEARAAERRARAARAGPAQPPAEAAE